MSLRSTTPSSCSLREGNLSTANILAADISTYHACSQNFYQGIPEPSTYFFSSRAAISAGSRDGLDVGSSVCRDEDDLSCSVNSSSLSNYRARQIQRILGTEGSSAVNQVTSFDSRRCTPSTHASDSDLPLQFVEANSDVSRCSSCRESIDFVIPRDLVESFCALEKQLKRREGMKEKKRYSPLSHHRIVSVLNFAKGDVSKSYHLCLKYSALLDRLGLQKAVWEDVETVLSRQCLYHLPNIIGKDGSSTYIIRLAKLPTPPQGRANFELYASSLLRAFLYHIEAYRIQRAQAAQMMRSRSNPEAEGGENISGKRKPGAKGGYTFIVDAHRVSTSFIDAIVPILPFGRDCLYHSYPLRAAKVLVWYNAGSKRNTLHDAEASQKKFPSQLWMTMCLMAYRVRYLFSPLRSRVHMVKVLDPFFSQTMFRELLLYIDQDNK